MPGNWHVRFGGAGRGNDQGKPCKTRPGPTPYQNKNWQATQTAPGFHQWTVPSGRVYTRGPQQYPT